jgi:hypothetical protein
VIAPTGARRCGRPTAVGIEGCISVGKHGKPQTPAQERAGVALAALAQF